MPTKKITFLRKIKSRTSSITAIQERKAKRLLRQYQSFSQKEIGQQLLAAFESEARQARNNGHSLKSGNADPLTMRKIERRKKRERYLAAVRACQLGHAAILTVLVRQQRVDPTVQDVKTGATLLVTATIFGHAECCLALLDQRHVNINRTDRWGWAPIHWAATDTHRLNILELYLKKKCKKNIRDGLHGRTPLEICCEHGNEEGAWRSKKI
jgi:ankyrin repeat protein